MKLMRIDLASLLVLLLTACGDDLAPSAPPPSAEGNVRYNVLCIVVDTLRADHLGYAGYARDTSPFLDELAAGSVVFDHCMTAWPKTGPAMAAFFTGVFGSKSGVARKTGHFPVPEEYDTWAELMQRANYQTMATVSNASLRPDDLRYGQGFDQFYHDVTDAPNAAKLISDRVREWMEDRDRSKPYFVWAHYIDPHTPYHPPGEYETMFVDDDLYHADTRGPVEIESAENADPRTRRRKPSSIGMVPRTAMINSYDRIRDYVALYDGEIRYFDDQLRSLFEDLREDGHLEDTVVVFTSDHGESLADHNYFFEHGRYPYDACSRIPMFVQHPDWAPRRITTPVTHLDMMPTLVASLDLELPWQITRWTDQGKSLLERIEKDDFPAEPVFIESGYREDFSVSVRDGNWKLILTPDEMLLKEMGRTNPYQLFDVLADPGETRDLYESEAEVVARLQPQLDEFKELAYLRLSHALNEAVDMTDEERQRLIDMGYLEDVADGEEDGGEGSGH